MPQTLTFPTNRPAATPEAIRRAAIERAASLCEPAVTPCLRGLTDAETRIFNHLLARLTAEVSDLTLIVDGARPTVTIPKDVAPTLSTLLHVRATDQRKFKFLCQLVTDFAASVDRRRAKGAPPVTPTRRRGIGSLRRPPNHRPDKESPMRAPRPTRAAALAKRIKSVAIHITRARTVFLIERKRRQRSIEIDAPTLPIAVDTLRPDERTTIADACRAILSEIAQVRR